MARYHLGQLVTWHQSHAVAKQLDNIGAENVWQQISAWGSFPLDSKKKMEVRREKTAKRNRTLNPKCGAVAYFQIMSHDLQVQVNLSQLKLV